MTKKNNLTPAQARAANPRDNVWVQANAGTGKTAVLVVRLLQILFDAPADTPTGVLCLTYTKAGAGEMRNRIATSLREWAMMTDDELRDELVGIAAHTPATDEEIAHARSIFFRYIDNPEMLTIKTIHSFCEEVLRRFPLEAGLSPSWTLISDEDQSVLEQDTFTYMISSSDNDTVNRAFEHIVGRVSDAYMGNLLSILRKNYEQFFQIKDISKYRKYFIDTIYNFLELGLPIPPEPTTEKLQNILNLLTEEINSTKNPKEYMTNLANIMQQYIDKTATFEKYAAAYMCRDKRYLAKREYLADELSRIEQIIQREYNQQIYDDTVALFDLAAAFAENYQAIKRQRNLVDFDDMILYTTRLFSKPDVMGWVLSQLDTSLHHILVDEAQDTSPKQWDIIRNLASDFFVGGDTPDNPHSIFVVGDTKQSIYKFQGADPRAFAASHDIIADNLRNNARELKDIKLDLNFRSLAAVLESVDKFFTSPTIKETLSESREFDDIKHLYKRDNSRGLVEIHPLQFAKPDSKQENPPPAVSLPEYINQIADKITELIETKQATPADIMVLVQQRNPFVPPLISELKRRGIDVAGSDRIKLPNFAPICDLMNLVRFCLNPTDDYSLCCVLKSPIFRLTEDDIYSLCTTRNRINYENKNKETTVFSLLPQKHQQAYDRLTHLLSRADVLGPYSFFSELLNNNNVREEIIAALGTQAIEPLDEFMTLCLSYERTRPGTLRHFIKWFITGGSEVKRDIREATGVRIATVHGSKGLEAPIIFMIDTMDNGKSENIVPIPDTTIVAHDENYPTPWLWAPRASKSAAFANAAAADEDMNTREYFRLLYVAMTRARDRLYIYGWLDAGSSHAPKGAWHTKLWNTFAKNDEDDNPPTIIQLH